MIIDYTKDDTNQYQTYIGRGFNWSVTYVVVAVWRDITSVSSLRDIASVSGLRSITSVSTLRSIASMTGRAIKSISEWRDANKWG